MNITIQSVKFDADKKLISFTEEKVGKLERFFDGIVAAEVILRVEKPQATMNKLAEIRLDIPGNDLFAKKQDDTFEAAVDQCVDALKTQLKRYKEKVRG